MLASLSMAKDTTTDDQTEQARREAYEASTAQLGVAMPTTEEWWRWVINRRRQRKARRSDCLEASSFGSFARKVLRSMPDRFSVGITMAVEVSLEGRPVVHVVTVSGEDLQPLDYGDLDALRLAEALDEVMRIEAQEMTPDRGYSPAEAMTAADHVALNAITSRDESTARRSVLAFRRRRQVTPQLLERVLALYDQGGIGAVVADTHYSESYCFKLLRKARAEVAS